MCNTKVEVVGGRVRLQRKEQSFVFPLDEAPSISRALTKAVRTNTSLLQQQAREVEMAGDTTSR